jgi:hypothetical protein
MFTPADRSRPVELGVNQINKEQVKGYASQLGCKRSDLATAAPATTPAANDLKALRRR